jgi:hypothetical protein
MNVSSDASNKGENDEYTGNGDDDANSETQEGNSQQEIGKGIEARQSKKDGKGPQGEEHPIRKQG